MPVVINGSTGITTPGMTNSGSTSTAGLTLSSGSITFPNADTQAVGPIGGTGSNQTWTSVTGSRAFGTTYTNSTGRPIMVSVSGSNNTNASWAIITPTVGGVTLPDARGIVNQSYATLSFIVPAGATYVITNSGTAVALQAWVELR